MGEIKSVKVDNWGVFFLQKLQNFFNKTDYCDLTLQFRDNSQLKVHRLVLSACTDYFNVLEQTCEVVDDALLMPDELQADVVVPIVNFMYTGTLEFELKMYGKLLRTAKEMNMTVLLKLLEAHRRTMEGVNRSQRPPSPKPIRRRVLTSTGTSGQQIQPVQQRRILGTSNVSSQQVQTKSIATSVPQHQTQFRQQIGSTSLLRSSASGASPIKTQYGTTTIYSRSVHQQQIKQEAPDYDVSPVKQHQQQQQVTSPFEQLRKGYNNNKRPATTSFISPPAKKPNIEDVKEFAEQQRMRKQIAAEYGDDQEYEGMLDDDIHNDDDDDDGNTTTASATASTTAVGVQATTSSAAIGAGRQAVSQGTTTITFTHDKPPTIMVKDSSNSNINHTKIITEVLRQYPHLVKGNKNIKLKIVPHTGGQSQKIILKRDVSDSNNTDTVGNQQQQQQQQPLTQLSGVSKSNIPTAQTLLRSTSQLQTQASKLSTQKNTVSTAIPTAVRTGVVSGNSGSGGGNVPTGSTQKRRIDSKTMHALIAMGAENTTGPWLCLRCGVNGRPISIPSYRGFRRHLINTHKETIDVALCEHCGWRSSNNRELHFHMQVEHKVKTTLYTFPDCLMCAEQFIDTNALNHHMVDSHPEENKQQCIYCNKIFAKELQLYNHMKTYHKKQALEDGIIDYSDEEFVGSQDESEQGVKKEEKVKILSNISLPHTSTLLKLDPSSEAAALSTVASGIATSIGIAGSTEEEYLQASENATTEVSVEPKFVNADGNEMVLTEEQRKEIISQLNQGHDGSGGVVMVLNESAFATEGTIENQINEANDETVVKQSTAREQEEEPESNSHLVQEQDTIATAGEATTTATAEEEFDDSQIYKELTTEEEDEEGKSKKITNVTLDESKESMDNLEWAENLISAHELADETAETKKIVTSTVISKEKPKNEDDISKKLKELTGDWSDDENDDDDLNKSAVEPQRVAEVQAENKDKEDVKPEATNNTEADMAEETRPEDLQLEEALEIGGTELKSEDEKINVENLEGIDQKSNVPEKIIKEDEDDIDVAMRSLHKEENEMKVTVKLTEKEQDLAKGELKEMEQATKTPELHLKVEREDTKTSKEDEKEEGEEEEKRKTKDDNAIDAPGTPTEATSQEKAAGKSLLDELISDADISGEEFIEENTDIQKKTKNEKDFFVRALSTDINSENADASKRIESSTDENSEAVSEAATDVKSTTHTEDKVKSLISEWGDDEDETEQENTSNMDNEL